MISISVGGMVAIAAVIIVLAVCKYVVKYGFWFLIVRQIKGSAKGMKLPDISHFVNGDDPNA